MEYVDYECVTCGNTVQKEMIALRHVIKGYGRKINDEAECCKNPVYIDDRGVCRIPREKSVFRFLPSIRT